MLLGFVILSAILGLRFEYGNDYISYSQKFLAYGLERFKFSDLTDGTISDPFWYLLNRLFYPFGFQTMVMFLTIVGSTAYYKLVRTLPKDLWVFGLFIYFFTNSFLPIQLSMLRQTLAMSLVIIAVLSILEKKYIYPLVLLVLASGIHSSAMICVPFILLLYLNCPDKCLPNRACIFLYCGENRCYHSFNIRLKNNDETDKNNDN